jgi:hypothetical protein
MILRLARLRLDGLLCGRGINRAHNLSMQNGSGEKRKNYDD